MYFTKYPIDSCIHIRHKLHGLCKLILIINVFKVNKFDLIYNSEFALLFLATNINSTYHRSAREKWVNVIPQLPFIETHLKEQWAERNKKPTYKCEN